MTNDISRETTAEKPLYISIKDIQRDYLPMLSVKRIRKIVLFYVHTIRVGNKILVNRLELEDLLQDNKRKYLV